MSEDEEMKKPGRTGDRGREILLRVEVRPARGFER